MIGDIVTVTVDRPIGSYHPEHKDIYYPINYGYIEGVMAPDGEWQDAYILGIDQAVEKFTGKVIAVIHRIDDIEDKWVVCPDNCMFSQEEILERVSFQEQYFNVEIIIKTSIILVKAEFDDIDTILQMQKKAFAELYEKYLDTETSPATEDYEDILFRFNQPETTYYFIIANGEKVGVIRVVDHKDGVTRKRISPIFIMPEHRNNGYAQQAIAEAERIHGENHWKLDTILQEKGNCYLYEKLGYHQNGKTEIINDKMTLVFYEKDGDDDTHNESKSRTV